MYDYLIVGAGLFGAVFAREAADAGKRSLVIDRRPHIAGNVYTESIDGITVHKYGAHIFHTSDQRVWAYMNRFTEFNHYAHSVLATYRGEVYNLPFNMNTFSRMWGIRTPDEAKRIIAKQAAEMADREPQNLEEQAISLVGRDIYEKLIREYTEKQWGRPCAELPASIIKRLPVRFTYDNNFYYDRYQGIPIGGYTAIVEKLLEGIEVRLNTGYADFARAQPDVVAKILYTGPIDEFFDYKLGALQYRSLRFETESLPTDNFQGCSVVNYTDRDTPYTRIIEHKHFEFGAQPSTIISREYPLEWSLGEERYYPVNDARNSALYQEYLELAKAKPAILFGGRLGEYRYYDMDQSVASALSLADKELCR